MLFYLKEVLYFQIKIGSNNFFYFLLHLLKLESKIKWDRESETEGVQVYKLAQNIQKVTYLNKKDWRFHWIIDSIVFTTMKPCDVFTTSTRYDVFIMLKPCEDSKGNTLEQVYDVFTTSKLQVLQGNETAWLSHRFHRLSI